MKDIHTFIPLDLFYNSQNIELRNKVSSLEKEDYKPALESTINLLKIAQEVIKSVKLLEREMLRVIKKTK
jgi:hypothetical protein